MSHPPPRRRRRPSRGNTWHPEKMPGKGKWTPGKIILALAASGFAATAGSCLIFILVGVHVSKTMPDKILDTRVHGGLPERYSFVAVRPWEFKWSLGMGGWESHAVIVQLYRGDGSGKPFATFGSWSKESNYKSDRGKIRFESLGEHTIRVTPIGDGDAWVRVYQDRELE